MVGGGGVSGGVERWLHSCVTGNWLLIDAIKLGAGRECNEMGTCDLNNNKEFNYTREWQFITEERL